MASSSGAMTRQLLLLFFHQVQIRAIAAISTTQISEATVQKVVHPASNVARKGIGQKIVHPRLILLPVQLETHPQQVLATSAGTLATGQETALILMAGTEGGRTSRQHKNRLDIWVCPKAAMLFLLSCLYRHILSLLGGLESVGSIKVVYRNDPVLSLRTA